MSRYDELLRPIQAALSAASNEAVEGLTLEEAEGLYNRAATLADYLNKRVCALRYPVRPGEAPRA